MLLKLGALGRLGGLKNSVSGGGGGGLAYLLRALFDRANTGTLASGDLEAQAAGSVTDGALTVVDTGTGTVEVLGNRCRVTGANAWNTTGIYGQGVTRAIGTTLITQFNTSVTGVGDTFIGWTTAAGITITTPQQSFAVSNQAGYNTFFYDGTISTGGIGPALTDATDYQLAMVLGGFDANGVPYKSGDTKANFTYGAAMFLKGGTEYPAWTLLWLEPTNNTTTMYPMITKYSSSTADIDNLRVPNADLSSVLQPTVLDTFTGTNGDAFGTTHNPEVKVGNWVEYLTGTTTFDIQSNQLHVVGGASRNVLMTEASNADVMVEVNVPTATTYNRNIGVILRGIDANNYWLLWIISDPFAARLYMFKAVSGGLTQLAASSSFALTNNRKLTFIANGTSLTGYYDGVNRVSVTSSVHQTATKVGVYGGQASQSDAARLDNFAAYPLTDATQYDAVFNAY